MKNILLIMFVTLLSSAAHAQFALNNIDLKLKNPPNASYTITQTENDELKRFIQFNNKGEKIFEYKETEIPPIFNWNEPHRFIYAYEYDSSDRLIKKYDFNSNAGLHIYTYHYEKNSNVKITYQQEYLSNDDSAKNTNAFAFISKYKNFEQLKNSEIVTTILNSPKVEILREKLNSNNVPIEKVEYSKLDQDTLITTIQYHLNGKELFKRVASKSTGQVKKEIMIQYNPNAEYKDVTNFNEGNLTTQYKFAKSISQDSKSYIEYAENKGYLTMRSYIYEKDLLEKVSVFQAKFEGELIIPITRKTMKTAEISYKYNDDGLVEKEIFKNYRNGKKETKKYEYKINMDK